MRGCQNHGKLHIKMMKSIDSKRAQEEIVGFSMIIVIVAIILIIFLSFSLKNPQKDTIESYEVEGYLQSLLQKTSDCRSPDNLKNYSVKDLMFRCYADENCLIPGQKTCDSLVKEIGKVSNQSWNIGKDSPVKGYVVNITVNGGQLKALAYGNQTRSSKGASQELTRDGNAFNLEFKAYY
jgi:hypothetical protein